MSNLGTLFRISILAGMMFIYGYLFGDNIFKTPVYKLHGPINPTMSEPFREWITSLDDGEVAMVRIETYGGHLTSGFKIAHYLKVSKADVTCLVDSHAMSAGAVILQNCAKIKLTDTSTVLYHLPRYRDPSYPGGVRLVGPEHPLHKMFMEEVDKEGLLTKEEREAMLRGDDIYIPGKEFMKRFYLR